MLQTDAFCEHKGSKMQLWPGLRSEQRVGYSAASPDPLARFKG